MKVRKGFRPSRALPKCFDGLARGRKAVLDRAASFESGKAAISRKFFPVTAKNPHPLATPAPGRAFRAPETRFGKFSNGLSRQKHARTGRFMQRNPRLKRRLGKTYGCAQNCQTLFQNGRHVKDNPMQRGKNCSERHPGELALPASRPYSASANRRFGSRS